jgi:hypothetical protein
MQRHPQPDPLRCRARGGPLIFVADDSPAATAASAEL